MGCGMERSGQMGEGGLVQGPPGEGHGGLWL